MTRDVQACIEIICNFPTIYKIGNKTPVDIVAESGYNEFFKEVTIESIATYLTKRHDLIVTWIQFSDDIRHNPAWGFAPGDNGTWNVAYSHKGKIIESFTFDNEVDACAKMVKETVDGIGKHKN
jgi:hypothetical protein